MVSLKIYDTNPSSTCSDSPPPLGPAKWPKGGGQVFGRIRDGERGRSPSGTRTLSDRKWWGKQWSTWPRTDATTQNAWSNIDIPSWSKLDPSQAPNTIEIAEATQHQHRLAIFFRASAIALEKNRHCVHSFAVKIDLEVLYFLTFLVKWWMVIVRHTSFCPRGTVANHVKVVEPQLSKNKQWKWKWRRVFFPHKFHHKKKWNLVQVIHFSLRISSAASHNLPVGAGFSGSTPGGRPGGFGPPTVVSKYHLIIFYKAWIHHTIFFWGGVVCLKWLF